MIYRTYGRTNKRVSVLGFGGMRFAQIENPELCVTMMLEAAAAGVNYFDTAPKYFDTKGETVFGGVVEVVHQRLRDEGALLRTGLLVLGL